MSSLFQERLCDNICRPTQRLARLASAAQLYISLHLAALEILEVSLSLQQTLHEMDAAQFNASV